MRSRASPTRSVNRRWTTAEPPLSPASAVRTAHLPDFGLIALDFGVFSEDPRWRDAVLDAIGAS